MTNLVHISPSYRLPIDKEWPIKIKTSADEIKVIDENGSEITVKVVEVYTDVIYGWFFDVADRLNKASDGFVILMIGIVFLGSHSQLRLGKSSDRPNKDIDIFAEAFIEIVGPDVEINVGKDKKKKLLENAAKYLYWNLRSGLFHDLLIRHSIELKAISNAAMEINWTRQDEVQYIGVDPRKFIEKLKNYFEKYLEALSKDINLQTNFINGWNAILDNNNRKFQPMSPPWQPSPSTYPISSYSNQYPNTTTYSQDGTVGYTAQNTMPPFYSANWKMEK